MTQVSLAVVLVIGAGLLVRSFQQLLGVETGFNAGGVLKAEYQLQRAHYPADLAWFPRFTETHAFNTELLRRVAAVPSVMSAAIAGNHPLDAGATNSFVVIGREAEAADWPEITVRRVTPGYFSTVELALRDGRVFDDTDATIAPPVAVINAAAARRFFEGEDPSATSSASGVRAGGSSASSTTSGSGGWKRRRRRGSIFPSRKRRR